MPRWDCEFFQGNQPERKAKGGTFGSDRMNYGPATGAFGNIDFHAGVDPSLLAPPSEKMPTPTPTAD
jgi:hypothetical protein